MSASKTKRKSKKKGGAGVSRLPAKFRSYSEHEAFFRLKGSDLADNSSILRSIETSPETFPRMAHYVQLHQRWRYHPLEVAGGQRRGLTIHYHPSAGSMVNGTLAIMVTADVVEQIIEQEEVVAFIEGSGSRGMFRVDQPFTFHVPLEYLKGIQRDGWFFRNRSTGGSPESIAPARIYIAQMSDITTPADADAIDSMSIIGEFSATWAIECYEQAPLRGVYRPPTSGLGSGLPASRPPGTATLDGLDWRLETKVFSPDALTGANVHTVPMLVPTALLTAAGVDRQTAGFDPSIALHWIGLDVISLDEDDDWYKTEVNTENHFPDFVLADGNTRDLGEWIGNKVDEVIGAFVSPEISLWTVIRDAGVLLARLFLGRGEQSAGQSALDEYIHEELILLNERNPNHWVQELLDAKATAVTANLQACCFSYWYVGPDYGGTGDPSRVSAQLATHTLTITKKISSIADGSEVFFPSEEKALKVSGTRSTSTTQPMRDLVGTRPNILGAFAGTMSMRRGDPTQQARLTGWVGGPLTAQTIFAPDTFPVFQDNVVIGESDLSSINNKFEVKFFPAYYAPLSGLTDYATAVTGGYEYSLRTWLELQIFNEVAGYGPYQAKPIEGVGQGFSGLGSVLIKTVSGTSLTTVDVDEFDSHDVVVGVGQIVVSLWNTDHPVPKVQQRILSKRMRRALGAAAGGGASSSSSFCQTS